MTKTVHCWNNILMVLGFGIMLQFLSHSNFNISFVFINLWTPILNFKTKVNVRGKYWIWLFKYICSDQLVLSFMWRSVFSEMIWVNLAKVQGHSTQLAFILVIKNTQWCNFPTHMFRASKTGSRWSNLTVLIKCEFQYK